MTGTPKEQIQSLVEGQREYFRSGITRDVEFRLDRLEDLRRGIVKWQDRICGALWDDLHKSPEEAYLTEVGIVLEEISNHLRSLRKWSSKKRRPTPLTLFPSSSYQVYEPLGNTLIVAPWNYPFQLLINPLVGCLSAGCTAILKPSPYVERTSLVLQEMIEDTFDPGLVAVVQGHRDVNAELFSHRYDLIFLTGSPDLGRIAMSAAAKYLTPTVLELGGKSPCIVDSSADIDKAAMRIAWGKTLNGGQTCIAPDYLFVHRDVKERFVEAFGKAVSQLHGEDVSRSRHYVHMVSERAFDRVVGYLRDGEILFGGHSDRASRYIEPTLLGGVDPSSPVMQEEIFGPVFPVMEFTTKEEVLSFVSSREKPLAFYYFGSASEGWDMVARSTSGGACINDTIMHIANGNIPFGGVGNSGMGRYHGRDSFLAFSHVRSVVKTPTWVDMPFRYMPYRFMSVVRRLMR